MSLFKDFSYAQARAQARFSELLGDQEWNRLAAARTFATYLEEARNTRLRSWVAGFSTASDSHDIERGIRAQFQLCVSEVAEWVPLAWRPAVEWVDWLVSLPLLHCLLDRQPAPAWARRDKYLSRYLASDAGLNRSAVAAAGGEPLLQAADQGEPLEAAWLQTWRQKWPSANANAIRNLERLTYLLNDHRRRFPLLAPEQAWPARDALCMTMRHLFHRYLLQPASLFIFICLVACDLERLRRALVSRALFPAQGNP